MARPKKFDVKKELGWEFPDWVSTEMFCHHLAQSAESKLREGTELSETEKKYLAFVLIKLTENPGEMPKADELGLGDHDKIPKGLRGKLKDVRAIIEVKAAKPKLLKGETIHGKAADRQIKQEQDKQAKQAKLDDESTEQVKRSEEAVRKSGQKINRWFKSTGQEKI